MYVVKGSWAGQTFALATSSDSGGRKLRIRRSKEERKAMVESFIQRYQNSNGGNFPSLNLTHKEVGGSFYTVREIVREIIQENRVLGPARSNPEVDHDDAIMINYPLGSIATEPADLLLHDSEVLNVISKHQEKESMELPLDDNIHYTSHQELELIKSDSDNGSEEIAESDVLISNHAEHAGSRLSSNSIDQHLNDDEIDSCGLMDGAKTNGISDETDKREAAQLPGHDILEVDKELAVIGGSKAKPSLPTEEVVVETFPLETTSVEIDDVTRLSTESRSLTGTLNSLKTKPDEMSNGRTGNNSPVISLDPVITEGKNSENSILGQGSNMESELETNGEVMITAAEMGESPLIIEGTSVLGDCTLRIASHSGLVSETSELLDDQLKYAPTGAIRLENRNGTSRESNDSEPHSVVPNGIDIHRDNKALGATSAPLHRINLQSWERAESKQQPNQLLALFKAFVDAFVKLWS